MSSVREAASCLVLVLAPAGLAWPGLGLLGVASRPVLADEVGDTGPSQWRHLGVSIGLPDCIIKRLYVLPAGRAL